MTNDYAPGRVALPRKREVPPARRPDVVTDWLLSPELVPAIEGDALRPLYDAAARGELALPCCGSCDLPLELEQDVCDGCGAADRTWRVIEPVGVVHSSTMMHRLEPGLVRSESPYPIVDVELSSGHRLIMTTLRPASALPPIDAPVRVSFRRLGDVHLPAIDNSAEEMGDHQ
jgi:uncharacterized OB-fold protein